MRDTSGVVGRVYSSGKPEAATLREVLGVSVAFDVSRVPDFSGIIGLLELLDVPLASV